MFWCMHTLGNNQIKVFSRCTTCYIWWFTPHHYKSGAHSTRDIRRIMLVSVWKFSAKIFLLQWGGNKITIMKYKAQPILVVQSLAFFKLDLFIPLCSFLQSPDWGSQAALEFEKSFRWRFCHRQMASPVSTSELEETKDAVPWISHAPPGVEAVCLLHIPCHRSNPYRHQGLPCRQPSSSVQFICSKWNLGNSKAEASLSRKGTEGLWAILLHSTVSGGWRLLGAPGTLS